MLTQCSCGGCIPPRSPCDLLPVQEKHICICPLTRGSPCHLDERPELSTHCSLGVCPEHLATTAKLPLLPLPDLAPQVPRVSFGYSAGKRLRAVGHEQGLYPVQLIERSSKWAGSQPGIEAVFSCLPPLLSLLLQPPKGPGPGEQKAPAPGFRSDSGPGLWSPPTQCFWEGKVGCPAPLFPPPFHITFQVPAVSQGHGS